MTKSICGSFVIGGLFGVLVQALYSLFALMLGADNQYLMVFSLIAGGFVVMILYITGATRAIDRVGGFGAIIPLIGIVSATAGGINAAMDNGKTFVEAYKEAGWPIRKLLIKGFVIALILSFVVCAFMPSPALTITAPDAAIATTPMAYVWSFVIMGIICAIGQFLMVSMKLTFPGVLNMLLVAYVIGCMLAFSGIMQALNIIGPGGAGVPIMGGGEFVFTSVYLGMKLGIWEATIQRLLIFTGIVSSMFIWGSLGALIKGKMNASKSGKQNASASVR